MRRLFRGVFYGLTGLCGLGVSGILLARWLAGERAKIIAFLNIGLHLLLLPTVFLLPLMLVSRRWKLAALLSPGAAHVLTAYAGLPRSRPSIKTTAPGVSILTYNLHVEEKLFQPMLGIIQEADADLIFLQEVTQKALAHFRKNLTGVYPYHIMIPDPFSDKRIGRAIFSRYPLSESETWSAPLPQPSRLVRVDADINGRRITLYNLHASSYFPMGRRGFDIRPRSRQIQHVLAQAAREPHPVIWAGDFNMTEWSDDYHRIRALFGDSFAAVGHRPGFTYPDYSYVQARINRRLPSFIPPITRIDYVFYSQGWQPVESYVWPHSGGSDHRPVFARLALGDCS